MTDQHPSKNAFFERVGALADEMIAAYGPDFAMGTLIITARFIAEGKPVGKMPDDAPGGAPVAAPGADGESA